MVILNIKQYEFEITNILNELDNLKDGCFYEDNCVPHPGTASAKTIAKNVKESFIDLMKKIANDEPGFLGK